MPAKTPKQYRFMQAVAHGGARTTGGPSESLAREFISKTPPNKRKEFMKKRKSSHSSHNSHGY